MKTILKIYVLFLFIFILAFFFINRKQEKNYQDLSEPKAVKVTVLGAVLNPGTKTLKENMTFEELFFYFKVIPNLGDISNFDLNDLIENNKTYYVPYLKIEKQENVKININTASKEELMTLPGIGEAKAIEIINYRTKHGYFNTTLEIMNVLGIKEATYEKIKDYITV